MRCGEWNTQNEEETLPYQECIFFVFFLYFVIRILRKLLYQEVEVTEIERHPKFEIATHKNNFAILFLEGTGFDAATHIAPICLPQVSYQKFFVAFF